MAALRNGRRERFAQLIAKGRAAADAYADAGYREDRKNAHRLANEDDVRRRIAELQERGAMRAEVTLAEVTDNLRRIAASAEKEGGAPGLSVARAAWMDVAKLNGLVVDKAENVNLTYEVSAEPISDDEWKAKYASGADDADTS